MSEEEKEAINKLGIFVANYKFYNIKRSDGLEDYIEIVLDLIEKQQKELNSLKEIEQSHKEENGKLRVEFEKVYEDNLTLAKELKQEKEKNKVNKVLEDDLKLHRIAYIDTPEFEEQYISKNKTREILERCFDDMTNHNNLFNCGDMQMLENNILELLEEV